MKNIINKILYSLVFVVFLAATAVSASAVAVAGAQWDGPSEINPGASTSFSAAVYSMSPPVIYSIGLYDSSDKLKHSYVSSASASSGYFEGTYQVTPAEYGGANGTYTIKVSAIDSESDQHEYTLTLKVGDVNAEPVARAGNDMTVNHGSIVSFDGSASYDPDGSIVSYEWDFGDGTTATGVTTSHSFAYGNFTVTLTITDNEGKTGTDTVYIISDGRPTAVAGGPSEGYTDEEIRFDASDSTDNGNIVSYVWDFGDGENATGVLAYHTYSEAGSYTVTLTVTDNDGTTHTDTMEVVVKDISEKPAEVIGVKMGSISLPDFVNADGSLDIRVTFDNKGDKKLENVKVTALVQELGLVKGTGSFDVRRNKDVTKQVALQFPDYAKGDYDLRLVVSNDKTRRVVHRIVTVE